MNRLGRQVPLMLVPLQHFLEALPADQLGGQHPRRAQLAQDVRHVDNWMLLVVVGEGLLVLRLQQIVDLLAKSVAEVVDERSLVKARKSRGGDPAQQRHVPHVRGDAACDARVLHRDRDRSAVLRDRPVHLSDGGGGKRQRVPSGEEAFRDVTQLVDDDRGRQGGAHRRGVVLQPSHRGAKCLRHVLVDVARHLAKLHEGALHIPELVRHLLGRAQRQVVAQLASALHGGEDQLRRPREVAASDAQCEPCQRRGPTESRLMNRSRRSSATHARMRSSMRSRASITPGIDSYAKSIAPMSWRTGSRSIDSGGGSSKPYMERAQSGRVPIATCPRSRHSSRVSSSSQGGSSTRAIESRAAGVACSSSTDSMYSLSAETLAGTSSAGTPTSSANLTISDTYRSASSESRPRPSRC